MPKEKWKKVSIHALKGNAQTRADGLRRAGYRARIRHQRVTIKKGRSTTRPWRYVVYRGNFRERKFKG